MKNRYFEEQIHWVPLDIVTLQETRMTRDSHLLSFRLSSGGKAPNQQTVRENVVQACCQSSVMPAHECKVPNFEDPCAKD